MDVEDRLGGGHYRGVLRGGQGCLEFTVGFLEFVAYGLY